MVVRLWKGFKKNLGMGEWAPPRLLSSSATPLPPQSAAGGVGSIPRPCVSERYTGRAMRPAMHYKIERPCFLWNRTTVLFYSWEGPIILMFSVGCLYLYSLMSFLHVVNTQIQGFPLLARVSRGLEVSYWLPDSLIHSLLLTHTKAQGFFLFFWHAVIGLINRLIQTDRNNYLYVRVYLYSL